MAAPASTIEAEEDVAAEEATARPPKKSKLMLIIILVLLLAGGGGGGYWYYLQKQHATTADKDKAAHTESTVNKAPAGYLPLTPPFVVNLSDTEAIRYLQVDMEVMSRDPKVLEEVKTNMPRIRNRILLLLGQQKAFEISTRESKEALQGKVLAEIQAVLKDETGKPGVEAVYFTSFVTQ